MRFFMAVILVFSFFSQLSADSLNLPQVSEETIDNGGVVVDSSSEYNVNIAVFLDKEKFFKFIPNIINSMNAYLIKKDVNYHIKLFNLDKNFATKLDKISPKYRYIFVYPMASKDINVIKNYPDNIFFIPTLNQAQATFSAPNVYFGGIDYQQQVNKLNQYVTGRGVAVYQDSKLSKYITQVVQNSAKYGIKVKKYPLKWYGDMNRAYVYLNLYSIYSVQVLANLTYHRIRTKAILTTQLSYSPTLFLLTSSYDTKDMILANSIFNIDPIIEDNNNNLNSNIKFNWLNYTTSTLLNLAYNMEVGNNIYYLNDFHLNMFFNQVQYKTNLYRIFKKGFIKIAN